MVEPNPAITMRMLAHFNHGGGKGSGVYAIVVDGVETKITREYSSGKRGVYSRHFLRKGEETLDLLDPVSDPRGWILARMGDPKPAP